MSVIYRYNKALLVIVSFIFTHFIAAQNTSVKLLSEHPDLQYFDFLIGKWKTYEKSISNGDTAVYGPSVISIAKSSDGFSIIENWQIKNRDTLLFKAVLHRVYNGMVKKWILSYSDSELNYQVWDGKKENNVWQFYRDRYKGGRKIIVKQKWIATSSEKVQQIIERSFNDGATWVTGSVIEYIKMK